MIRAILDLLGRTDTPRALRYAILSGAMALFEVLSFSLVIPLLTVPEQIKNLHIPFVPASFATRSGLVLIAICVLFALKNLAAFQLQRRQSGYLDDLYLRLSDRIYRNFFTKPWTSVYLENPAETFRKIKNTPYLFTSVVVSAILALFSDVIVIGLMLAVAAFFDYRIIATVILLGIPVLVLFFSHRKNSVARIDQSFRALTPKANVLLNNGIQNSQEIRTYHKENYFIEAFLSIIKRTSQDLSSLRNFAGIPPRLIETIAVSFIAILVFVAAETGWPASGVVSYITVLSVALYKIIPGLNRIIINLSQIQAHRYIISELSSMMASNNDRSTESTPLAFCETVSFKNVTFRYDKAAPVIHNLNLSFSRGEFVVLHGASGSGKSTVLHLLAGLAEPASGAILCDGVAISANVRKWQSYISLVPQFTMLLQDTVTHNIAFGIPESEIDTGRVARAARLADAAKLIAALPNNYETVLGENGHTLSGGQRQRLVLARALYRDPEILILDEVTNQLDEVSRVRILQMLKSLCREGKTVIMATHDPLARSYATSVFQLTGNRLVSDPVTSTVDE